MKEYWVNVYEGVESRFLYQCAKCLSREDASQLSGENRFGYCGQTLYRIHVKMKEPKQIAKREAYLHYTLPTSKHWMD